MVYTLTNKDEVSPEDRTRVEDFDILYLDHIQRGANKQDAQCVFSVLEAVLLKLKKLKPEVDTITIQSDNAKCYQCPEILIYVWLLAKHHGFKVQAKFIHTETQDGKGVIDGHSAIFMMHVLRLVAAGENAITPAQLVSLMRANGGISNSYPELYTMNRDKISRYLQQYKDALRSVSGCGRWNEVVFSIHDGPEPDTLTLYEYSGMDGVTFELPVPSGNSSTPLPLPLIGDISCVNAADAERDPVSSVDADVISDDEDGDPAEVDQASGLIEDGAGIDESEMDAERLGDPDATENIVGDVTGVEIESDVNLAKMRRRWKTQERS